MDKQIKMDKNRQKDKRINELEKWRA
jgi:hypothetical protein